MHIPVGPLPSYLKSILMQMFSQEHLTRLRLYACAAYVRKFSQAEDLRNATLVGSRFFV
jgi:hypothetical protein